MKHFSTLIAFGLLGVVHAQVAGVGPEAYNNTNLEIQTCDALPCAANDNSTICWADRNEAIGVGLISNALNLSDTLSLPLTLIDGYSIAFYSSSVEQYDSTTRTLYAGAPQDANLTDQSPGCMLMMQYQSTTFPYAPKSFSSRPPDKNSTNCPYEFLSLGTTSRELSGYIRDFEYDDVSSLGRCEALASYVEYRLRGNNIALGFYYASLVSVTGGAVSGPDVETDMAEVRTGLAPQDINPESCQPVQPSSYQLCNVTSATQILREIQWTRTE